MTLFAIDGGALFLHALAALRDALTVCSQHIGARAAVDQLELESLFERGNPARDRRMIDLQMPRRFRERLFLTERNEVA
jgi:hypothetical protein